MSITCIQSVLIFSLSCFCFFMYIYLRMIGYILHMREHMVFFYLRLCELNVLLKLIYFHDFCSGFCFSKWSLYIAVAVLELAMYTWPDLWLTLNSEIHVLSVNFLTSFFFRAGLHSILLYIPSFCSSHLLSSLLGWYQVFCYSE